MKNNMKQHITKEQWNELTPAQRQRFLSTVGWDKFKQGELPSIGEMIEFLGDKWQFIVCYHSSFGDITLRPDNLCDALFESVSYKLSTG